MKCFRLCALEFRRLWRSPVTWLAVVLALASPLLGYSLLPLSGYGTMATLYLANPIALGTLAGTGIFLALTLYEQSRVHRFSVTGLVDSLVSPTLLAGARTGALLLLALATAAAGFLGYLPYTIGKLDLVFSWQDTLLCWFLLLFPGWVFGILAASAAYLVTRRVEVSALAVAVFYLVSRLGGQKENPWWQWCLPSLPALSDDFGSALLFRAAAYNRLIWLCLLGGVWGAALLCQRRYGKGLAGSLRLGLRRIWPGGLALCLVLSGGLLWAKQPLFDHTPADWMSIEEESHAVEGLTLTGTALTVDATDTLRGALTGTAVYQLENTTGRAQDLFLSMNTGYTIDSALVNGQPLDFTPVGQDYIAARNWTATLPAGRDLTLEITYHGVPRLWNVSDTFNGYVISARYVELTGRHLAPVLDLSLRDEATPITLEVTLPEGLTPVTSGYATQLLSAGQGTRTWQARDTGEDGMLLIAGDYEKVTLDGGGMPIEFYYSQTHKAQLEALDAIPTMEAAVAYCTQHYGPRSFTPDKPFKIIQGTEFMFGGFAKYNISAMFEDSFSANNLDDQAKGASGAEVLAHEIIHQWWGLGAQLADEEDPYWTAEGVTTYATYRLMEALQGEAYAKAHYLDAWAAAVDQANNNFYVRHPEYLDRLPESLALQLQTTVESVNLYDGAAALIKQAETLVGGQEAMDAILSQLYYDSASGLLPYLSLQDFLDACQLTKEDVGRG